MSTDDDAADTLRDEELAATLGDALEAKMRDRLKELHTSLPGIIKSFDAKTQTATVQPAINRIWVDDGGGGSIPIPLCSNVPVQFPRGGGYVLTFPVTPGDECLLVFAERAIDNWWANGGNQDPAEFRMHDYSDGFAILGFASVPNVPGAGGGSAPPPSTTGAELRTLDGSTVVRVEKGTVTLGDPANAVAATLATLQNLINQAVAGHVHVTTCPAGAGTAAPSTTLANPADVSARNVKIS